MVSLVGRSDAPDSLEVRTMANTNKTQSTQTSTSGSSTQAPAAPAPSPAAPPPGPTVVQAQPPPNAALVTYVAQSIAEIDAAEAALAVDPPALTPSQKRRAGKLRSGGDKAVGQIATLAKQYGVESSVLQADSMTLALEDAQALAPLVVRIQAFAKHVADLVFLWESAAWADAMQFYALLQRRSLVDGAMAASLQPVAAFFAKRHNAAAKTGKTPKRTARANAKAVKRLKKAAPQLLAASTQPGAAPAPAPAAATAASAAAPSAAPPLPPPTAGNGAAVGTAGRS
jgi:hypothetical protein